MLIQGQGRITRELEQEQGQEVGRLRRLRLEMTAPPPPDPREEPHGNLAPAGKSRSATGGGGGGRCGERRGGAELARMREKQSACLGEPRSRARPTLTFRAGGPRLWAGTSYTWEGSVGNEARTGLGIVKRALEREEPREGDVTAESADPVPS